MMTEMTDLYRVIKDKDEREKFGKNHPGLIVTVLTLIIVIPVYLIYFLIPWGAEFSKYNVHVLFVILCVSIFLAYLFKIRWFQAALPLNTEAPYCKDIPSWLIMKVPVIDKDKDKDVEQTCSTLKDSRDEMYRTLELYHSHVKVVIIILTAVIGGLGAARHYATQDTFVGLEEAIPIFLIYVIPLLTILSIFVLYQYYKLYLSALLFAVCVHIGTPYQNAHPWLTNTIEYAKAWSPSPNPKDRGRNINGQRLLWPVKNCKSFRLKRALWLTPPYTFVHYAIILIIIAWSSIYLGGLA